MQTPEWTKPAVWSAVAGALAITIVGFSANWVMTTGAANTSAAEEAELAVLSALTPICVAQFRAENAQLREVQLAAMAEQSNWERGEIVAAQGWATMPGADEPNEDVAELCSEQLLEADEAA
ncbi:hypothetical protein ACOI1H_22810 [Loktanella sp. DJP18]|uniref:hypothetical protein n=1 Tax=Loktanella sp. DJP18 TaxID=3409788 RepID=UPI003BB53905